MKRKLGGETTMKMTTYKDGVFASILAYMELHDVGFSVAVHEVVTAGFEAQERELNLKTDIQAIEGELEFLRLRFRNIEKATIDLGEQVFPQAEEQASKEIPEIVKECFEEMSSVPLSDDEGVKITVMSNPEFPYEKIETEGHDA